METGMNPLQRSYKIYKCTLTVSPHYLIKLNHIKQHTLKAFIAVFYYSMARMSLWAKWAVFLQVVFKMSTFYNMTHIPTVVWAKFYFQNKVARFFMAHSVEWKVAVELQCSVTVESWRGRGSDSATQQSTADVSRTVQRHPQTIP